MAAMNDLVRAEIEQSERTRHDVDLPDTVATRPGRAAAKVYSVRLATDTVDELERVAKDLDVPTSALIRGYIMDGLAGQRGRTVADVVEQLHHGVDVLRGLIGPEPG